MNEEAMDKLGDKGYKYYNSLREFYDEPDRLKILDYIIRYATEELCFAGTDDDKAFFERVRLRGYAVVKKLYDANINRLYEGKGVLPLRFPSTEQIRERIRSKYSDLEKKIKGGD
jgi:hypothetical protein